MPTIYIAMSPALQEWGSDVGVSKHIYKAGWTADAAKDAVDELNAEAACGQKDWQLIGERASDLDAAAFQARLSERQKTLDPLYYPRIKGAKDMVKIEQRKVEANLVIKRTMEGRDSKVPKLKPADYADYILESLT